MTHEPSSPSRGPLCAWKCAPPPRAAQREKHRRFVPRLAAGFGIGLKSRTPVKLLYNVCMRNRNCTSTIFFQVCRHWHSHHRPSHNYVCPSRFSRAQPDASRASPPSQKTNCMYYPSIETPFLCTTVNLDSPQRAPDTDPSNSSGSQDKSQPTPTPSSAHPTKRY